MITLNSVFKYVLYYYYQIKDNKSKIKDFTWATILQQLLIVCGIQQLNLKIKIVIYNAVARPP